MFGVPLHKLLTHFPISLAVVGCGYDLWALYASRAGFHRMGSALIRLAAVAALASLATGLDLAGMSGLGSDSAVTGHALVAMLATGVLAALAIARYSREVRARAADALPAAFIVVEVSAVVLVFAATILGHRI